MRLTLLCLLGLATFVHADERTMTIAPGQTTSVSLAGDYKSHVLTGGGEALVAVQVVGTRRVNLVARRPGTTFLIVFGKFGKTETVRVTVGDPGRLVRAATSDAAPASTAPAQPAPDPTRSPLVIAIERQLALPGVRVRIENGEFFLEGTVSSEAQMMRAEQILQRLSPRPIINRLQVGAPERGAPEPGAPEPVAPTTPTTPPPGPPPLPSTTPLTPPTRGFPGTAGPPPLPTPTEPRALPVAPKTTPMTPDPNPVSSPPPARPMASDRGPRHTVPTPTGPTSLMPKPEGVVATEAPLVNEVGLGVSVHGLNNRQRDWRGGGLEFNRVVGERRLLFGAYREQNRFGLDDRALALGYEHPLGRRWTGVLEAEGSPQHRVLPEYSIGGSLLTDTGHDWQFSLGYRRSEYDLASTNFGRFGISKRLGPFRAGYTLELGQAEPNDPVVGHRPQFDWFYRDASSVGLSFELGRMLEEFGPPRTVNTTSVAGLALNGNHWFTPVWGLQYSVGWLRQGNFYHRRGGSMGVRYRF